MHVTYLSYPCFVILIEYSFQHCTILQIDAVRFIIDLYHIVNRIVELWQDEVSFFFVISQCLSTRFCCQNLSSRNVLSQVEVSSIIHCPLGNGGLWPSPLIDKDRRAWSGWQLGTGWEGVLTNSSQGTRNICNFPQWCNQWTPHRFQMVLSHGEILQWTVR